MKKKEKVRCLSKPGTWKKVEEKLEEPSESFALVTVSLFNKKLDLVTKYMIKNILHEQSNQKVVFLKLTQK